MSPRRAPDLDHRRALIVETARRTAESEGWDAVTIRRVAAEVGVTQPVLYTVFDGRQGIVDAVALGGFERLTVALRASAHDLPGAVDAYLRFAAASPATYDAMFVMRSELPFAQESTPPVLLQAFDALTQAFASSGETSAEVVWSLLHGLVTLERAGRVRPEAHRARMREALELLARRPAAATAAGPPAAAPGSSAAG